MQRRDPYSIVDLLQTHHELTGADDSLEIAIESISENEIWGQEVFFRQLINGQPTNEVGSLFFSPDGAVTRMGGDLINTESLNAGDIVILAPEAEAIALQSATGYAATVEPENPAWSDVPVTLTARSVEMGYELDAESNLVRLWRARVDIDGPAATGVVVSISAETGEVLSMRSANVQLIFNNGKCLAGSLCSDSTYTTPMEKINDVLADVQATSPRSLPSHLHIIVNYPFANASGDWDGYRTIRLSSTDVSSTAAHEAFHVASYSPEGDMEHGLVYAMTAIRGDDYPGPDPPPQSRSWPCAGPNPHVC